VSRVLRPAQHITAHFGDESFQAITRTGTDNSKQTAENTPKTQRKIQNKQTGHKTHKNTRKTLNYT